MLLRKICFPSSSSKIPRTNTGSWTIKKANELRKLTHLPLNSPGSSCVSASRALLLLLVFQITLPQRGRLPGSLQSSGAGRAGRYSREGGTRGNGSDGVSTYRAGLHRMEPRG